MAYAGDPTRKSEASPHDNKNFSFIPGSLQVGDNGQIWNLFWDEKMKKVRMKVGLFVQ